MIDVQAREISEKDLEAALRFAHPEVIRYWLAICHYCMSPPLLQISNVDF